MHHPVLCNSGKIFRSGAFDPERRGMASAISQLASAPFANMLVIAALGCIAIAIFGWARETIAASSGFRAVSGLTGALLLFCVYGIYLPHAARNAGSNDPEDVPQILVTHTATNPAGRTAAAIRAILHPASSRPKPLLRQMEERGRQGRRHSVSKGRRARRRDYGARLGCLRIGVLRLGDGTRRGAQWQVPWSHGSRDRCCAE